MIDSIGMPDDPWGDVSGEPLKIGEVGVDSASIKIGDLTRDIHIFTPEGDGCYPVFIQKIKGRRCLIIDFDL